MESRALLRGQFLVDAQSVEHSPKAARSRRSKVAIDRPAYGEEEALAPKHQPVECQ